MEYESGKCDVDKEVTLHLQIKDLFGADGDDMLSTRMIDIN